MGALAFELPTELQQRLDEVSQPEIRFPYTFFEPSLQGMVHGGASVGDKPVGYAQQTFISGEGAGTE